MNAKFYIAYDRPIHPEYPTLQTDHCQIDLPRADSKETALKIVENWKSWFRTNKCFNIRLCEKLTIETPISLE